MAVDTAHGEELLLDLLDVCHVLVEVHGEVVLVGVLHGDILEQRDAEHVVAEQGRTEARFLGVEVETRR